MKKLFEEPCMELEVFAISDSTLFLSGYETGEDELDHVSGTNAYGNMPAIG